MAPFTCSTWDHVYGYLLRAGSRLRLLGWTGRRAREAPSVSTLTGPHVWLWCCLLPSQRLWYLLHLAAADGLCDRRQPATRRFCRIRAPSTASARARDCRPTNVQRGWQLGLNRPRCRLLPHSWRAYLLLVSLPAAIVFLIGLLLPESPRGSHPWPPRRSQLCSRASAGGLGVGCCRPGSSGGNDSGGGGALNFLERRPSAHWHPQTGSRTGCRTGAGRAAGRAAGQAAMCTRSPPDDILRGGTQPDARPSQSTSSSAVALATSASRVVSAAGMGAAAFGAHHVCALLRPSLRRTTLLLSTLWFAANFASGWWTWLPSSQSCSTFRAREHKASPSHASSRWGLSARRAVIESRRVSPAARFARQHLCSLLALTLIVDDPSLLASDLFLASYSSFALFFGVVWPVMYVVTQTASFECSRMGFGFVSSCSKLGDSRSQ